MSWNPKYIVLLITSTIITYLSGLLISSANKIQDEKRSSAVKKLCLVLGICANLSILFFFKYYNFFTTSFAGALSYLHIKVQFPHNDFLLPVGISFYTFQALSYIIDVYRKDVNVEKNLGKLSLYISFFPQLLSGPISKSKNMLFQYEEKHYFDYDRVKNGMLLILWGLFQKTIIADRLAVIANTVFSKPGSYKGFEVIIASLIYTFQIYIDFSSYSDMAIGSAEVMGFRLPQNFERPYFSKSIREFWKRWHITLGAWFMDYLYIPLGGNRCSKLRNYINLMIVFLLCGLWHGASITFVIWGALHGIYQVIGKMLRPIKKSILKSLKINTSLFIYKLYQVIVTFILVDFAWIFFKASTLYDAVTIIKNMFYFNPWVFNNGALYDMGLSQKNFIVAIIGIAFILIINLIQRNRNIRDELAKKNIVIRWFVYLTAVTVILVFGFYGPGFNPQKFIYFQF